jgi:hypothetical protein
MTFGSGPEGTETHRRPDGFLQSLWAEDGTALVVRVNSIRTPVRNLAESTDITSACRAHGGLNSLIYRRASTCVAK